MDYVDIGKITSPSGIKGEVKIYPYMEPEFYEELSEVFISGRAFALENLRWQRGMAVVRLSGVEDRNSAEALRGLLVSADKGSVELPEKVYFTDDLKGMDVYDEDGRLIGKLTEVIQNPAHDIYKIEKPKGGDFLLPAVDEFVLDIGTKARRITVHLIEGLEE